MAARYWVGGTGTWSSTNTTNWSATSGGAGGASVPGSADTTFFDANSGTGTVTFTNGAVTIISTAISTANITLSLDAAFTLSNLITVSAGTFTTNNYSVTAAGFALSFTTVRTINLGSSTVTLTASGNAFNATINTNLTFNAGTSTITFSSAASPALVGGAIGGAGLTFYNVSFTSTAPVNQIINGSNTFNNLSFTSRNTTGINFVTLGGNQTITGTFTLSPGASAVQRRFIRSDTIGTVRTLTIAGFASGAVDNDFRDITVAGAASPISGTRFGNCGGNTGITFSAAKTVYFRATASSNWSANNAWSASSGGTADITQFPLAQDTAVFPSATYPASGSTITVDFLWNLGTINMSARTSNTMTLATGVLQPFIYGNWINGTGTTISGSGQLTFAGQTSQTITSAGKAFLQAIRMESPGGSVTLQDAFTCTGVLVTLVSGTFEAATYNVTLTSGVSILPSVGSTLIIGVGSGTWAIAGTSTNAWKPNNNPFSVTGTGTLSFTSSSAKTFDGAGIQTYPTINQGGTGTLTIADSNKFANITNTAIGRVQFIGGTTNEFTAFNLNGVSGNLLPLGSSNTTRVTLKKPTAWDVGANSVNSGNNIGLSFTAGGNDYLNISYVIGVVTTPSTSSIYYGATNVTSIYYGSSAVTAIYYGSTKVF